MIQNSLPVILSTFNLGNYNQLRSEAKLLPLHGHDKTIGQLKMCGFQSPQPINLTALKATKIKWSENETKLIIQPKLFCLLHHDRF